MKHTGILFALVFTLAADCDGDGPSDAGPDVDADAGVPLADCFIGDPVADAEIELVFRTVDGEIEPFSSDPQETPLILPIQGGKVTYVGIRARNITCDVQVNAGLFDDCQSPPIVFGRDARPIVLEEGPDGFGIPINSPDDAFVANMANLPVCPAFVSVRDGDGYGTRVELRATEARREGEATARTHLLTAHVRPVCAQPEFVDECACECDADFSLEGVECATIHDNDLPRDECPVGEGEGEGE